MSVGQGDDLRLKQPVKQRLAVSRSCFLFHMHPPYSPA
jgi:hypothetical protein